MHKLNNDYIVAINIGRLGIGAKDYILPNGDVISFSKINVTFRIPVFNPLVFLPNYAEEINLA